MPDINHKRNTVASGYHIHTTGAHEAIVSSLKDLPTLLVVSDGQPLRDITSAREKWRVERGSKVVVCVPSLMSLSASNLETMNPTPLVFEVVGHVRTYVRSTYTQHSRCRFPCSGKYYQAFFVCREHHINLEFFIEHNETAFLEKLGSFVEQVMRSIISTCNGVCSTSSWICLIVVTTAER